MSDEIEKAVAKPFGVAAWFLTPLIIGVCLVVWFAFFRDTHTFSRTLKQDEHADKLASRDASAVGEKVGESPQIHVVLKPHGCWAILSANLDLDDKSDDGHVVIRNKCGFGVDYFAIDFKLKAADGTTVGSGIWKNGLSGFAAGETVDAHGGFNGDLDPRASTIILSTRQD